MMPSPLRNMSEGQPQPPPMEKMCGRSAAQPAAKPAAHADYVKIDCDRDAEREQTEVVLAYVPPDDLEAKVQGLPDDEVVGVLFGRYWDYRSGHIGGLTRQCLLTVNMTENQRVALERAMDNLDKILKVCADGGGNRRPPSQKFTA